MLVAGVGAETHRCDEDAGEGDASADEEASEHPVGGKTDEVEDCDDFGGEGNGGATEELTEQDLDGIEPIQRLRLAAMCDALIIVAFAKVP